MSMFQFSAAGVFANVAVAASGALAVVLYRVGASGSVARQLSLLLFVESVTLASAGSVSVFFGPAILESSWWPAYFQAEFMLHTFGDCAMLALYPSFLATALHTKLTRPFGSKGMRMALALISVVIFIAIQLTPLEIGAALLYIMLSTLFGFALVASIHAWRVAAPGIARTRARIFALAFGVRDICWGSIYLYGIWQIAKGIYLNPEAEPPEFFFYIYAGGTLFAVPLIAYGILRTQLFDIDLRIRWTIKQSTLAAAVVAIMYLLSEGATQFLSSELGEVSGLLAAALVIFFLAPLQRFAERVASVAMPNTKNTPEYAIFRKLQVYEAAIAEAQQEGGISDKERSLLNRLRDSLGISESDAEAIELELQEKSFKGAEAALAAG